MSVTSTVHALTPINWSQGNCRNMGDDAFFDQSSDDVRAARLVCADCSIRAQCAIYGMTQTFGMWGGLSERDRRRMRISKSYIRCDVCQRAAVLIVHNTFVAVVCERCGISSNIVTRPKLAVR